MAGSFVGVRWNTKASEFKKLVAQLKVEIFSSQGVLIFLTSFLTQLHCYI